VPQLEALDGLLIIALLPSCALLSVVLIGLFIEYRAVSVLVRVDFTFPVMTGSTDFKPPSNKSLLPMRVGVLGEFGCLLVAHGRAIR
jgi:hypothetical protein